MMKITFLGGADEVGANHMEVTLSRISLGPDPVCPAGEGIEQMRSMMGSKEHS
jgi:hypothetical protein